MNLTGLSEENIVGWAMVTGRSRTRANCVRALLLVILMVCFPDWATGGPAVTSPADTLALFGGPGTLEGKFENENGEPDRQGWTTRDDTAPTSNDFWQVSGFRAANLDTTVGGNHAWWCGRPEYPACNPGDPVGGYGNNWNAVLAWGRAVDPSRAATVTVTGILNVDLEPGYDFLYVEFVTSSSPRVIARAYDGYLEGLEFTASHTYEVGDYVGATGDSVEIWLRVVSDHTWSDEDCLWGTVGAAQVDNLQVTVEQAGGAAWIGPVESCEPGVALTWRDDSMSSGSGNFAQLWTGLPDIDPDHGNDSAQWAFLSDGEIVPNVPASYTTDPRYPADALAWDYSGGRMGDAKYALENSLISPPIAVPPDWSGVLRVELDVYFHTPVCRPQLVVLGLLAEADATGSAESTEIWMDGFFFREGPLYERIRYDFARADIPGGTEAVRIRVQCSLNPVSCYGFYDHLPAPYIDNVRLQLAPGIVSDVPAGAVFAARAYPNPFNPSVEIHWQLAHGESLKVSVYDVLGRRVAVLRDGPAPVGPGSVAWSGADDSGLPVAAGLYFCRLTTGRESRTLKLTLLK